jgi:hypothetical protein
MKDQNRILPYVLLVSTIATLIISCVSLAISLFVITRLNSTPSQLVYLREATPAQAVYPKNVTSTSTRVVYLEKATPTPSPVIVANLIANGDFENGNVGRIPNWASTNVEPLRWYVVQAVSPDKSNAKWVERVDLSAEARGYGLMSIDRQSCDYFCSTEAVQIVPAQENQVYTLSAEARIEEGTDAVIYLDFLNADKVRIKPHTQAGYSSQWSRQSLTAQAPAETRYIRVILYTNNQPQGIVYWDNVELRLGDE